MNLPPSPRQPAAFVPAELTARFEASGSKAGFRVERFGEIGGCALIALTKRAPGVRPRIYLSSGIHGDEPAPPLALLEMLEAGVFDQRANWFICPLLNPAGFPGGCRENGEGVDLNRDYRHLLTTEIRSHVAWLQRQPNFDVTFCLHEDWGTTGFYIYELNPDARPSLVDTMLQTVSAVCPLETAAVIDGREAAGPGIIRPIADPSLRELWPEAIYLLEHHARLSYTLETPSALPIAQRIRATRAAVEAAVRNFCNH